MKNTALDRREMKGEKTEKWRKEREGERTLDRDEIDSSLRIRTEDG